MPCAVQASLLCATQATCCVLCTLIEDLLSWLTGVNDSPMQSAIAAIAVQQAGLLQQLISDDPLGAASMWEHTCSTKPWDASTIDATHDSECDGAAMGTVWPHVDKKLCHYGMRADTRKLVVVAFELFQSLTAKAKQAGTSLQGTDIFIPTLSLLQKCVCSCDMHVHVQYLRCWPSVHVSVRPRKPVLELGTHCSM